MPEAMLYHADCRHFRGDIPCAPNKREGVHCEGCAYYDPVSENVLIIKLGAAGDVLRTTPLLHPLKLEHPNARIWWLTQSPELVPGSHVDRILKWSTESLQTLDGIHFARLINLDKDAHACALATRLTADRKEGFINGSFAQAMPANDRAVPKFLTGLFDDVSLANRKDYFTELFEICGYRYNGETYLLDAVAPISFPDLDLSLPLIGLNTGAGARWTSRLWSTDQWIELVELILASGKGVLLLGGPDEDERNRAIHKATRGGAQYIGYYHLREFIALMDHCELVVTGVTMGMHIALALRKKTVLINNIFNPFEFSDLFGLGEIVQPDKRCMCYFRGQCVNPDYFCLDHLPANKIHAAIERVSSGRFKQASLDTPGLILSKFAA
ncbi:MAG: glycosyltransferase family 9 protein [Bacteroidota bacterium]|nr:glycosyltransferase family 9 protein [Bacteroidota bacterium]MDP4232687.1 glycosyltransferase family 9 protein [Bacteroidota bacterium]MDP4243180.1 glycosyltransferase family 9 protein [Bacteroidota bacterium]MDP4287637.1 glycosyltransferase family 9 protein [Bacteroidota bacterium]